MLAELKERARLLRARLEHIPDAELLPSAKDAMIEQLSIMEQMIEVLDGIERRFRGENFNESEA